MISDRGVRRLADVLTHNHTVSVLHLYDNRHSAESAEYVQTSTHTPHTWMDWTLGVAERERDKTSL